MTRGAVPVRTRGESSPNVMSLTWCRASTGQWLWTSSASCAGLACSGGRLVTA